MSDDVKDPHAQGGQRTRGMGTRAGEWTAAGALAMLAVSYMPAEWADPTQRSFWAIFLTGAFKEISKQAVLRGIVAANPNDRETGPGSGITKVGIVLMLFITLGCATGIGHQKPIFHTGADGETVMACEQTGIHFAFGDASQCGTQRGGATSTTARDTILGTFRLAAQVVSGFFMGLGGAGAGMAAGASAPLPEQAPPPVVAPVEPAPRAPKVDDVGSVPWELMEPR